MNEYTGVPQMAGIGTFRLKGDHLLTISKKAHNMHQVSRQAGASWPTIHKYMTSDKLKSIDLEVLADLLLDGIGLTPEELAIIPFGEIFEFVESEKELAE
jgi:hypothetical protein